MGISDLDPDAHGRRPWNAGNMVGAKRPLKPRDVSFFEVCRSVLMSAMLSFAG